MTYDYEDQQVETDVARAATNKIAFDIEAVTSSTAIDLIPGEVDGTTANLSLSNGIREMGPQTIEIWPRK